MRKIESEALKKIAWVEHAFYTRDGAPADLVSLHQTHSNKAYTVSGPWPAGKDKPQGDALVTDTKNLDIAVRTADCAPVLFAAKSKPVVAAAHAGWKGAIGGVLEATVEEMKKAGADPADIVAVIGPCIGPASYEVSADFKKTFLAQDSLNEKFFKAAKREGHYMFDLPAYSADRLQKAGVGQVEILPRDTLAEESDFFSHRRATLRGEADNGRQMSAIKIKL